ncbi:ankyrin repeat domain-containing protein [Luteibacter sp.]|uniref:ankyrin repeat domain-containing protein n=1 Tax=Luteibacter sp. TaxID=1886636 RepID=UPI0028083456|nr:ankyrin repeat domain-containing protein [Luteibacter sp.]MDQ8048097.1 ankyrin repeat domain-containing protein [Luteibacter sp.]
MNHDLQRMLEDACWDGEANLVASLIARSDVDPAAHHSTALLHAAHRGHWRCVQMLIPVSNPKARNSEALWRAAKHRRMKTVRLLAPVSDTSGWDGWMWDDIPVAIREMCSP